MTYGKIQLNDEQIKFLSEKTKEGLSVYDAISKWNQRQERMKGLGPGVVVKVVNDPKWSNWYNKKGFIVKTLVEPGQGFDPDRSGKFSVYLFDGDPVQGDLLGYTLKPIGEYIDREFLLEYKQKYGTDDFLREELDSLIKLV